VLGFAWASEQGRGTNFVLNAQARERDAIPAAATGAVATGKTVEIKAPLGLPPVPIPPDNPPTAETIALGRRLYYDAQLSSLLSTAL
jgi:cytochrome c peroxidase